MMKAISRAAVLIAVAAVGQALYTAEDLMDAVLRDLRNEAASRKLDPAPVDPFGVGTWGFERGVNVEAKILNGSIIGFGNAIRSGNCSSRAHLPMMTIDCKLVLPNVRIMLNAEVQESGAAAATNKRMIAIDSRTSRDAFLWVEMQGRPGRRARFSGIRVQSAWFKSEVVKGSVRLNKSYPTFVGDVRDHLDNTLGSYILDNFRPVLDAVVPRHLMPS